MRARAKRMLHRLLGEAAYREIHARSWAGRLRQGHEHAFAPIIERYVKAGGVCLDIGAHGGSVTVPLSRAVGPDGHVFAFEARPDYAATLERTLSLLKISNVTVLPFAIGERNAKTHLVVETTGGGDLTGRSHLATDQEGAISVPVLGRTLDSLAREIPRICEAAFAKVDVEGAELFVLRGGLKYFAGARPVIYCEVQEEHCARYGHTAANVVQEFDALGYSSERVNTVDVLFTPRERFDAN